MNALRSATYATILLILLTGCSCEQRLQRLQAKCGVSLPVTIDTVITYRDSLYLDTIFESLTDTLVFTKDSITVVVLRDTVTKRTFVTVTSHPVDRVVTVSIPVSIPMAATWSNWWAMTRATFSTARWVILPLVLILLAVVVLRFLTSRK